MKIKKEFKPLFAINALGLVLFSVWFLSRGNYEFIIYIFVMLFFFFLIMFTLEKVNYSINLLWALTVWAFLHMAGGGFVINGSGDVLYKWMILPIIGEPYNIFKFDQFVHFYGFWVATILSYHLLKPFLKDITKVSLSILLVTTMAGLGFGALNEIVEFSAVVILKDTGVGGYENTALDLVFNFLGAIGAASYIRYKVNKKIK